MKGLLLLILVVASPVCIVAQSDYLEDSTEVTSCKIIGDSSNPKDFTNYGLSVGDTMDISHLYNMNLKKINVDSMLLSRKHLLVVFGSNSCNATRRQSETISTLRKAYRDITVLFVYLSEAHAWQDETPFVDSLGNALYSTNHKQGLELPQHTHMIDRKNAAINFAEQYQMLNNTYLDGPNNYYLKNCAAGPSSAFLLNKKGVVRKRLDWFNSRGSNIFKILNEFLESNSY